MKYIASRAGKYSYIQTCRLVFQYLCLREQKMHFLYNINYFGHENRFMKPHKMF